MKKRITRILIAGCLLLGVMAPGVSRAQDTTPPQATVAAPPATPTVTAPAAATPTAPAAAAAPAVRTNDPEGVKTGGAADLTFANPSVPTIQELAEIVGHNKVSINIIWMLIGGFLVMFMQPGFAMVETGFCRTKNVAHMMAVNLMIYPLGVIGFYILGFALMMGGSSLAGSTATLGGFAGLDKEVFVTLLGHKFGIFGFKGFFLSGSSYDVALFAIFLFQMVFMDTTATIPTGALAERWKYSSFFIYGLVVSTIMYPVFGNWVWGGGWLSQLGANFGLGHGHVDFAGSSVVHLTGGVISIVAAKMVGPRLGKYNKDGSSNALPAHNLPMVVIGTFILAFGWFGFNAGSTLAGTDLRLAVIATNTMLASATGAFASTLWMWWFRTKKPDPSMMCNGMLAGLVAITAPCAFVNSGCACLIGLIAGVLVVESVFFIDRVLKIDDPVGAISVHGVCGAFGCLALGLFADGHYGSGLNGVTGYVTGLFYGDGKQFVAEVIGVLSNILYIAPLTWIVFKVIDLLVGNRVSEQTEREGLDLPEMGVAGYDNAM